MGYSEATEMLRIAKIEKLIPMMYAYAPLFHLQELEERLIPFFQSETDHCNSRLLSIKEIAVILKITEADVYKLISRGEIEPTNVTGQQMITDFALKDYLLNKQVAG